MSFAVAQTRRSRPRAPRPRRPRRALRRRRASRATRLLALGDVELGEELRIEDVGVARARSRTWTRAIAGGVLRRRAPDHSRCSSPITGERSSDADLADRQQHAGHERLAVDRVVADRQRLADVAEDDLLVGDQAGQADRVDRHVALHQLGRARRRCPTGASSLPSWCSSMISALAMCLRGLGGELHHQHGADREVRAEEDVGAARARRARATSKPLVPITTCTPAATASRALSQRLVGLREVDEHVGVAEHVGDARAQRRVGAPGQLHVVGALDGGADGLPHAPGRAGDGDADRAHAAAARAARAPRRTPTRSRRRCRRR